jgi:hypothetical protein
MRLMLNGKEIGHNHNLLDLGSTPEKPLVVLQLIEFKFLVVKMKDPIRKRFPGNATVKEVEVEFGTFRGENVETSSGTMESSPKISVNDVSSFWGIMPLWTLLIRMNQSASI